MCHRKTGLYRVLSVLSAVFLIVAFCGSVAWSQPKEKPNPYAPLTDTPGLPRVLLIGDSISVGYTIPVQDALKGKANVHRPPTNCGPTIRGLEQLDQWLGDGRWDLIHFNWGLHDLRRDSGDHQVPIEQYEVNLDRLVRRLKETGAKLVWCSTTPVPEGAARRVSEDVPAYNAVAKKVMETHSVSINDLYAFALPRLNDIQRPRDVHYTPDGSKVLGAEVARVILESLGK